MGAAHVPPAAELSDDEYAGALEQLVNVVQELSLARTLADVQRIVRSSARQLTGADGTAFILRDDDQCYYADEDAIAPLWKGSRFPMETCISGWAMLNHAAAVIPDIYLDDRIPQEAYRPTFVKSLVMVPIRKRDPVGAIGIYWADQRQPSEREVALLQALADSTSIAMEHAQVYAELEQRVRDRTAELERANEEIRQLSVTDDLTGLYNRRGFFLLAEPALRAERDHGRDYGLAFIDMDGLKRVNDEAGHDVGDELIADMALVLRNTLGPNDILARIGGDEFCVFFIDSRNDPAELRERLFAALRAFNTSSDRPHALSASVGVLHVPASSTDTLDELLVRADELMYVDKRAKLESA
jgi:diguanylate cyclase (GGDEF)-like protein